MSSLALLASMGFAAPTAVASVEDAPLVEVTAPAIEPATVEPPEDPAPPAQETEDPAAAEPTAAPDPEKSGDTVEPGTEEPGVSESKTEAGDDEFVPLASNTVGRSDGGSNLITPMVLDPDEPYCNANTGSLGEFQQQHVDGHYTSGNAGKGYTEGDWVRQRARLTLSPGDNQLVVQFGALNGNTVGYDNLRFVEVQDANGNPVNVNANVILSTPPMDAVYETGTINFTIPEGTAMPVYLYYEVHLSNSLDYYDDGLFGAAYYSGSSLHTGLVSLNCEGQGTSSLSIPVNALEWGTITVDKVTDPANLDLSSDC